MICKKHDFEVILRERHTPYQYARCSKCEKRIIWAKYHLDEEVILAGSYANQLGLADLVW